MTDIEYTQEIYKERKFCPLFTSLYQRPATTTSTKQLQQPKAVTTIYLQAKTYTHYTNSTTTTTTTTTLYTHSTCWTCLW